MGLLDDIKAESSPQRGPCTVGVLLAELPDADAKDLQAALDDDNIPTTAISRVLKRMGTDMHEKRVRAHRKGQCACAG
jgi:hypothetical protein